MVVHGLVPWVVMMTVGVPTIMVVHGFMGCHDDCGSAHNHGGAWVGAMGRHDDCGSPCGLCLAFAISMLVVRCLPAPFTPLSCSPDDSCCGLGRHGTLLPNMAACFSVTLSCLCIEAHLSLFLGGRAQISFVTSVVSFDKPVVKGRHVLLVGYVQTAITHFALLWRGTNQLGQVHGKGQACTPCC
eukprot:1158506-Pelagomonas_calceolata.AAC.3